MLFILMSGTNRSGFKPWGPFRSHDAARIWAEDQGHTHYEIMDLEHPDLDCVEDGSESHTDDPQTSIGCMGESTGMGPCQISIARIVDGVVVDPITIDVANLLMSQQRGLKITYDTGSYEPNIEPNGQDRIQIRGWNGFCNWNDFKLRS